MRKTFRIIVLLALAVALAIAALLLAGVLPLPHKAKRLMERLDPPSHPASAELLNRGVLIDPGHGGFDVGALGASGAEEDKLNLAVAILLKDELEARDVPATLLRQDGGALGETKEEDMEFRANAIRESNAVVFVSIHMNSFPSDASVHGPQTIFNTDSKIGRDFAESMQPYLDGLTGTSRKPMEQQLKVLSAAEGHMPGVLIECGFLTNEKEEQNLSSSAYQKKLASAIADGLLAYCDQ